MSTRCNLHTHSSYCDGKSTLRENVQAAISQGLEVLGFSGHSYTAFDTRYCMSREGTAAYRAEIRSLQTEYAGRLQIRLGIEQDYFAEEQNNRYDYTIGAVHYVAKDDRFWDVDESLDKSRECVNQAFCGDFYAYSQAYYALVADLPAKTGCQIVAHLDLLTKFNEGGRFFNENDPRYLDAAFSAIAALSRTGVAFEINTGAISRGYRSMPYPSPVLLKEIRRQGGRIILGSDSHCCDTLEFYFSEALELARSCGFRSRLIWEEVGFKEIAL
ncbi:MAG: histidinol-phosphatase [Bacillota bacterium]|nr:histidinol-phosphatase [Bacillota bacterium]